MRIDPKDLPALSAWLLEYPVGYSFSHDTSEQGEMEDGKKAGIQTGASSGAHRTNLDGEPLVLVKVRISKEGELGDR